MTTISQVQEWRGHDLSPETFGWKDEGDRLVPQQGFEKICPKEISGELKCSCRKGCSTAACSCVKLKFKCSIACKCGDECQNYADNRDDPDKLMVSFSSDSESDTE